MNTGAIQALLSLLAVTATEGGLVGDGPTIGAATFTPGADATSGELAFAVDLASMAHETQYTRLFRS